MAGSKLNLGTLAYELELDADPFEKGLRRSVSTAQRAGTAMTLGITAPLVTAGAAGIKMAMDFDTAFSRMVGLAGVPKGEIDGLKESVLDLAGRTAQAPQELAAALYDAASAGLTGGQAMEAVTKSAEGAAAGLGSVTDIAGLVASAISSYGAGNIDAARTVDVLTATIRAGRADPAELAGTLGRILPIAAQLGIGLDEVGGAVAYLSNIFGDTNRTVTATSGLLIKLVSPSQQGRKALEEMGTSAEELQGAIDKDGLLGALELLRSKGFAGNQQALRSLFDDIEGYQAALALLNDESGSLNETMAETAGSSGALADALGEAMGTDGMKAKQAIVDLQVALITMGQQLAPVAADAIEFGAGLVRWFSDLPGPAQKAVIAFGALLAAVGPLVRLASSLQTAWSVVPKIMERIATSSPGAAAGIGSVAGAIGRVGLVVGGLYLAGEAIDAILDKDYRGNIPELENALLRLGQGAGLEGLDIKLDDVARAVEQIADPSIATQMDHHLDWASSLGGLLGEANNSLDQAKERIDGLDKALASLVAKDPAAAAAALEAIAKALGPETFANLLPLLDDYDSALTQADTAQRAAGGGAAGLSGDLAGVESGAYAAANAVATMGQAVISAFAGQISYDRAVLSTDKALHELATGGARASGGSMRNAAREAKAAERAMRDAARGIEDANEGLVKANERLIESQQALADAQKPASGDDIARAELDIAQARLGQRRDAQRMIDAEKALEEAREDGDLSDVNSAEISLQEARLSAKESVYSVKDAEARLAELRKKGTAQDAQVVSAQEHVEDAFDGVRDAQERVAEAHERAADAADRSTESSSAAGGAARSMAELVLDAKEAIEAEAEAWVIKNGKTLESVEGQRLYIEKLRETASELAPGSPLRVWLDEYIAKLDEATGERVVTFRARLENEGMFAALAREGAAPVPQRARGGRVWAGQAFLVGEEGPELVVPTGAGHVFDANTTEGMFNSPSLAPSIDGGGGAYIDQSSITNIIQWRGDAGDREDREQLRREVQRASEQSRRRSGSSRPTRYRP